MIETALIQLLVPPEILEHFDYEGYKEESGVYRVYFTEKDAKAHIPNAILQKAKWYRIVI